MNTNNSFMPATRTDLDAWILTYDINVTTLIDAPGSSGQTLQTLVIREATAIIQLPGMNVVWYDNGDQSGLTRTGVDVAMDEMLRLLGI